jgi:hypothetical protein
MPNFLLAAQGLQFFTVPTITFSKGGLMVKHIQNNSTIANLRFHHCTYTSPTILINFTASLSCGQVVTGSIVSRANGITAEWPCTFASAELQRALSNMVLATYVVNHCLEEEASCPIQ